jgi:hypothetical protein
MNKLSLLAAALVLASSAVHAAQQTSTFNVTMAFTSTCTVTTAATDMAFTYTAFGAADSKTTKAIFQCSRGLTPTFKFDDTGAAQTGSAAVALTTAFTGEGVLRGIRYTLAGASSQSKTGTAASAGAGGTGGSDGTADEYTVNVTANIAGGQAGDPSNATASQTRTIYIIY